MGRFKDEVYGRWSFFPQQNINQEFRKDSIAGEPDEPEIQSLFLFWECWHLWQDNLWQVKSQIRLEICVQSICSRLTMTTDTTGAVMDINTGVYTSQTSGVFKVVDYITTDSQQFDYRQSSVFLCQANRQQRFGLK